MSEKTGIDDTPTSPEKAPPVKNRGRFLVGEEEARDLINEILEHGFKRENKEALRDIPGDEAITPTSKKELDEYGVKLLQWANTGIDNGKGSIRHDGRDNKLGATEINVAFSDNYINRNNALHQEYALKAFDIDGDKQLSAYELNRMGEIAKEAGLEVNTEVFGEAINSSKVSRPKETPHKGPHSDTNVKPCKGK